LEKEVVTPNGTTHAGLQELKKGDQYFKECLEKAYKRAEELGKESNQNLKKE
jgi:pyrroline-5-carboxylate reductase